VSKTVLVLLVIVVAALVALLVTGTIDLSPGARHEESDGPIEPTGPGAEPSEPEDGPGTRMVGRPPDDRPELEEHELDRPARILLLVGAPQSLNVYLAQQWERQPEMTVFSWTAPPPSTAGTGPPPGTAMPGAWPGPPDGDTLHDLEIDAVAVHELDPGLVDDEFWDSLYTQVQEGRVGFLVVAGLSHGADMLAHPGIRRLLPVKKARAIEGPEKPGILMGLKPFRVTEAGTRHPATRLVPWPTWSQRIWDSFVTGSRPWGTEFVYPVEELAEGAETLLEVNTDRGPEWPAVIAGPPRRGRVLWLGIHDFADADAYHDSAHLADRQVLVRNLAAWLADPSIR